MPAKTRRPKHVNRCEVCGYPFLSSHSNAKTCSSKCRQRKYRAGQGRAKREGVTLEQLEMLLVTHGGQMRMF